MGNHKVIKILFPQKIGDDFPGMSIALFVFMGISILSLVRSLIHIFSPDGGAGSIAGMDLNMEGASGIAFAFALWGSSQLVYAVVQLMVAFRYRSLVPIMYLLLIFEILLRMLVGRIKPVDFSGTPPGAWGNFIILPIAALMLILCFIQPKNRQ